LAGGAVVWVWPPGSTEVQLTDEGQVALPLKNHSPTLHLYPDDAQIWKKWTKQNKGENQLTIVHLKNYQ